MDFNPIKTHPLFILFPALIILVFTVFWPAIQAFYLSFSSYENIGDAPNGLVLKT